MMNDQDWQQQCDQDLLRLTQLLFRELDASNLQEESTRLAERVLAALEVSPTDVECDRDSQSRDVCLGRFDMRLDLAEKGFQFILRDEEHDVTSWLYFDLSNFVTDFESLEQPAREYVTFRNSEGFLSEPVPIDRHPLDLWLDLYRLFIHLFRHTQQPE